MHACRSTLEDPTKYRNARDLSPNRPFETAWKQTGPTKVYKIEDTQLFGSNFYLTGMWSKVEGGFGLFGNGGFGETAPSLWYDDNNVAHDNFYTYATVRPQKQYRADGSYFLDIAGINNELKFGYGYRDTPVTSESVYPGEASGYWDYSFPSSKECAADPLDPNTVADPLCAVAVLLRPPQASYSGEYNELYVGDTILLNNLTIQVGLRYDQQRSAIQSMDVSPNPVLASALTLPCATTGINCTAGGGSLAAQLPGIDYPGQSEELEWSSIAPRVGITYALGSTKRTLLRAAYNRYTSQLGSTISSSSPVGNSQFTFWGVDANGDHTIQRNELTRVRNFTGINPSAPASLTSTRRIDYDMNPPHTDEFLIGFEHELWTDFSVGATFTHRQNNDLVALRYEKTQGAGDWFTSDDYVQTGLTQACSVPFVTVNGVQVCNGETLAGSPVYGLKPGVPNPTFSVITNRPDYKQTYNGVEVTATKRMSANWMLRVNASYNDYTEDCGSDSFASPAKGLPSTGIVNGAAVYAGAPACIGGQFAPQSAGSGAFGNVFLHSKYNANISGVYVAPWDINIGANLLYRQGYPDVLRAAAGAATIAYEEVGDRRFDNVYQLDLRLAKDFRILNTVTFTPSVDIFNATNERTILQRNGLTTAGNSRRITEMQAPRVFRVGGKITF